MHADKGGDEAVARSAMAKASWRLLPLIALGYLIAYMDRSNISFASLQMNVDLGFSAAVYGLGADATNADAIRRIFAAKGRPSTNPLICHVADESMAKKYVTHWPAAARAIRWSARERLRRVRGASCTG